MRLLFAAPPGRSFSKELAKEFVDGMRLALL
jgi:hypothetical protein